MGEFKSNLGISGSFNSKSGGGTQIQLSTGSSRGYGSVERIVRPFELTSVLADDRVPPPEEDPEEETEVRWGKASQFAYSITDPDEQLNSGGMQVNPTDDEGNEEEPPEPASALIYQEVRRIAFPIRIENPDDSSQYVIVQRIYVIVFNGNDGLARTFILDHPS